MNTLIVGAFSGIVAVLAADFAAGFIHWVEDAYIREHTPLIGRLIGRPNVIHHHFPRDMTRNSWWQSSWDLCLGAGIIVLVAGWLGKLTWPVGLFALVSANANEIHKWSHRTRRENGRLISFLQDIRLLQTPQHHAIHHTNPKEVHYCPVTNFVNPLLDRLHFWSALEWLLARTIGLRRRPDTSVPGTGPAPVWLQEMRQMPARISATARRLHPQTLSPQETK